MKKLFLMRHAKSSWKDETLDDFERPLNTRGERDVLTMAQRLKNRDIMPELIVSSAAKRAKKTAKKLAKTLEYDKKKILFLKELYESDESFIMKLLQGMDDRVETLLIIGHNPEFNIVAEELVGFDENIVTSGVVEIVFDVEQWNEVGAENARLISYDYPKNEK